MTMRTLQIWVVADAVLTLVVFAFVMYLSIRQAGINAKTTCWANVLDGAIRHHPPLSRAARAVLTSQASACAALR